MSTDPQLELVARLAAACERTDFSDLLAAAGLTLDGWSRLRRATLERLRAEAAAGRHADVLTFARIYREEERQPLSCSNPSDETAFLTEPPVAARLPFEPALESAPPERASLPPEPHADVGDTQSLRIEDIDLTLPFTGKF